MFHNTTRKQRKMQKKKLYSKPKKLPNLIFLAELNMYYVIKEIMTIGWQQGMRLSGGIEIIIIK